MPNRIKRAFLTKKVKIITAGIRISRFTRKPERYLPSFFMKETAARMYRSASINTVMGRAGKSMKERTRSSERSATSERDPPQPGQ